ncbi:MAG: thioesterase [Moorea sp. SIO3C2]|nr:thioesterase [Moorena sp. SIO3C2]
MVSTLTSNPWIICPKPNPKANLRLFCFPCAGGTASAYSTWSQHLPSNVEVCSIQLPGRGRRLMEPPFTRLSRLLEIFVPLLKPYLDKPFAFLGHSMGAVLAFEVARQLRTDNDPEPIHLFACACSAPQIPVQKPYIHKLPKSVFVAELSRRYNAIPESIRKDKAMMQLFLPSLRADLTMLETYTYTMDKPLSYPISVFGGFQDNAISIDNLEAWRQQTNSSFIIQMLSGDHFFLHNNKLSFLRALSQQLSSIKFRYSLSA